MKTSIRTGTMIAITAASLFAAACKKKEETSTSAPTVSPTDKQDPSKSGTAPTPAPTDKTAKVQCMGINDCTGKGNCKTASNDCAGKNGCKGKGFVDAASEQECKDKGGTVTAGMDMTAPAKK